MSTYNHHIETTRVASFPNASFAVVVDGSHTYQVSLKEEYYQLLTKGTVSPGMLIKNSFLFLLAREPKEAILKSFDLSVIKNYFSEYEQEIKRSF